jgi:hypothetical protein
MLALRWRSSLPGWALLQRLGWVLVLAVVIVLAGAVPPAVVVGFVGVWIAGDLVSGPLKRRQRRAAQTVPACERCGGHHVVDSAAIEGLVRRGTAAISSRCSCPCCLWATLALRAELARLRSLVVYGAPGRLCDRCGREQRRDWATIERMIERNETIDPCQCDCCKWADLAMTAELDRLEQR